VFSPRYHFRLRHRQSSLLPRRAPKLKKRSSKAGRREIEAPSAGHNPFTIWLLGAMNRHRKHRSS
jgi:hypothetical protein